MGDGLPFYCQMDWNDASNILTEEAAAGTGAAGRLPMDNDPVGEEAISCGCNAP